MTDASIPTISPEEARAKLDAGTAVLIDVRMPYDWAGGRVQGSLNLPSNAIQFRTTEVPKDKELVFVGANTSKGVAGAQKALDLGFGPVSVIDGGFNSWVDAGLPTETITG